MSKEQEVEQEEPSGVTVSKNDIGGVNVKITPDGRDEASLSKSNSRRLAWAMLQITEDD